KDRGLTARLARRSRRSSTGSTPKGRYPHTCPGQVRKDGHRTKASCPSLKGRPCRASLASSLDVSWRYSLLLEPALRVRRLVQRWGRDQLFQSQGRDQGSSPRADSRGSHTRVHAREPFGEKDCSWLRLIRPDPR